MPTCRLAAAGLLGAVLMLAACAPSNSAGPSQSVLTGQRRAAYDFAFDAKDWHLFTAPQDSATFFHDKAEGALAGRVVANVGHAVSVANAVYTDAIVEATVRQTEGAPDAPNSMGLVCRANSDGDGYYFLVSAAGRVSLRAARPGQPDLAPLVEWVAHPAVRPAPQPNTLVAVCVQGYLALYVNGLFAAEARDRSIARGQVGVALAATGTRATVLFDDVRVHSATLGANR